MRGQLGRSPRNFRLWQDKKAIAPDTLWEAEIKAAIAQAVFFIPIVTPTTTSSEFCRFEFEAFLAREREIGRADLIFPILYIRVPALEDSAMRKAEPLLSIIAERQYADWREFRHREVYSPQVGEAIERLCAKITEALTRPFETEVEKEQRQAEEAVRIAEGKRRVEETARVAEEKRRAKEAVRIAEGKRQAEETARIAEEKRQAEETARIAEEKRQAEEAARLAEEKRKAEETARVAEEKRRAEEERPTEALHQHAGRLSDTNFGEGTLSGDFLTLVLAHPGLRPNISRPIPGFPSTCPAPPPQVPGGATPGRVSRKRNIGERRRLDHVGRITFRAVCVYVSS